MSEEVILIPLTQNQVAIIDAEDFLRVSQHPCKWYAHKKKGDKSFYVRSVTSRLDSPDYKQKTINLHRFILNCPKDMMVDHINGDGLDNRKANLRICTNTENQWNRISLNHSFKFRKGTHSIEVRIRVNGQSKYICSCKTQEEAKEAYKEAFLKYRGKEFLPKELKNGKTTAA